MEFSGQYLKYNEYLPSDKTKRKPMEWSNWKECPRFLRTRTIWSATAREELQSGKYQY